MAQFGSLIVEGTSAFFGKVVGVTQAAGTNNETIATTAFVTTAINNAFNPTSDTEVQKSRSRKKVTNNINENDIKENA